MPVKTVKAREGIRVPMENTPRRYITDAKTITVPETAYYLRQIMNGDLVEVLPEQAEQPAITDIPETEVKRVQSKR
ncbi:hypothetical protein NCQ93_004098 [Salmonella enterica]|uniref:hypothetical protein n=1 Tax=Citrobacter TaxID=544 RepID=UPI001924E836|nr:hypothetical protein [Citrobacter freundii]EHZ6790447.1 hypothetical protein [Salmonella enterica]EJH1281542.1 hypothetical protein [Salmonella enterica]EJH6248678.1 hypothetical protein [Salmonella enterica]EJL1075793.1 hypothetical protein [Salmonella enterica]EKO7706463.1 hypothetical protein [Salmonella enterica]